MIKEGLLKVIKSKAYLQALKENTLKMKGNCNIMLERIIDCFKINTIIISSKFL